MLAAVSTGPAWFQFSLVLTWVGLVLLAITAVRAAVLSRRDKYATGNVPLRAGWLQRMDRDFATREHRGRNDHTAEPLNERPHI